MRVLFKLITFDSNKMLYFSIYVPILYGFLVQLNELHNEPQSNFWFLIAFANFNHWSSISLLAAWQKHLAFGDNVWILCQFNIMWKCANSQKSICCRMISICVLNCTPLLWGLRNGNNIGVVNRSKVF